MAPLTLRRKIILLGDFFVGKRTLIYTFVYGPVIDKQRQFMGLEVLVTDIELANGTVVELALWNTFTREEYDYHRRFSYRGADVILAAFAIDDPSSFKSVKDKWIPEVRRHLPDIPVVLVGCKADVRTDNLQTHSPITCHVPTSMAEELAAVIGARCYMECTTHDVKTIENVFQFATAVTMAG